MEPVAKNYPVNSTVIARIRAKAASEGVNLSQDVGTLNKSGITASYELKDNNLAVTLLSKPFFVSTGTFFEKLEETLGLV